MKNVIITGDFCPRGRVAKLFDDKKYTEVFGEFKNILDDESFVITNLEAPIYVGSEGKICKSGPNLKCNNNAIGALQYLGVDLVTLANNHFFDYGNNGVKNTINELDASNIKHIGGGVNFAQASEPLVVNFDGIDVAFLNFCENEFSIATEQKGGSNTFDIIENIHQIEKAKKIADKIILITHGGNELYQLPSPEMKKTYRFFIDCGVDVIINHHQHCYSGYEEYNGKLIFYGIGNFCFDINNNKYSIWNEGFALNLNIGENIEFKLIPYIQGAEHPGLILLNEEKKKRFFDSISELNNTISNDNILLNNYKKWCDKNERMYIDYFNPISKTIFYKILRKLKIHVKLNKSYKVLILNLIRCEAHRNMLINILNKH